MRADVASWSHPGRSGVAVRVTDPGQRAVFVAGRRSMRSNTEMSTVVGAQPAGGDARVDGAAGSTKPGSVVGGGGAAQVDSVTITFI